MVFQKGESSKQENREDAPSSPPETERSIDHPDTFDYKDVIVVLISWDKSEDGSIEQANSLEEVFRRYYNYTTLKLLIPRPLNPQFDLYRTFCSTLQEHTAKLSSRKTLLITCYIGHGLLFKSPDQFAGLYPTFSIGREDMERHDITYSSESVFESLQGTGTHFLTVKYLGTPEPQALDWSFFQNQVEILSCDVLVLIDSCFSGAAAVRRGDPFHDKIPRKEIIVAGGFGDSSLRSLTPVEKRKYQYHALVMGIKMADLPNNYTFTAQLVAALKYLATTEKTFTASQLALRAATNVFHKTFEYGKTGILAKLGVELPHPVHAILVGAPHLPSIPLRPLPRKDRKDGYVLVLKEAGDDLDDISQQKEGECLKTLAYFSTQGFIRIPGVPAVMPVGDKFYFSIDLYSCSGPKTVYLDDFSVVPVTH
ncbi:hypothetical protein BKA65DRAFT_535306 [Rhexocercosporidium sp. MPI-PUGE-AT-0058]|nr:hypothetical protein BKA65DRAFT_535306 [Rhexocercosporidium sp. MPI-PUGE-AT-0058]